MGLNRFPSTRSSIIVRIRRDFYPTAGIRCEALGKREYLRQWFASGELVYTRRHNGAKHRHGLTSEISHVHRHLRIYDVPPKTIGDFGFKHRNRFTGSLKSTAHRQCDLAVSVHAQGFVREIAGIKNANRDFIARPEDVIALVLFV